MKIVKKYWSFIQLLLHTHAAQRAALINSASREQLSSLVEILVNILSNIIPISDSHKRELKPYRDTLRRLTLKSLSGREKKKLLNKSKKLISTVFHPVYPLLKDLVEDKNGK